MPQSSIIDTDPSPDGVVAILAALRNVLLRVLLCALAASVLIAAGSSSLSGVIRDSHGQPVANAEVQLKSESQTLTAKTDSDGHYSFPALPAATYTLHAKRVAASEATIGPFTLSSNEQKKIDLTLTAEKPDFFDQPTFIVAGVTDSANRGGHGSDATLRSSEALTKAAASLGGVDEHGNPLETVREYQHRAELEPSERNLFDLGAELLAHYAYDPAIEVFMQGNRQFPQSLRLLLGLAVAYYAKGSYDQASQRFFEAADLNPSDPGPYLFLGQTESSGIAGMDGYFERMARFAKLLPNNAWANYYYAGSLWKQKGAGAQAEALLNQALRLDPTLAVAQVQLGIIYAARKDFAAAIHAYQKAIAIDPRMEQAHYRLAQAYLRTGENAKAQQEFQLHHQLAEESAAQIEHDRRQIRQFVIELRHR